MVNSSNTTPTQANLTNRMTERLTKSEELSLIKAYQDNDKTSRRARYALNKLVTHNMGLVYKLVNKFPIKTVSCSYEDLVQEGVAGFIHGVTKFDTERDIRLSTYVYRWIWAFISRYYQNHGRVIRVPVHQSDRYLALSRQIDQLTIELGRTPTDEEIRAINPDADTILNTMLFPLSLNYSLGEDNELGDLQGVDNTESVDYSLDCDLLMSKLRASVSERDYLIMVKRYGLDGAGERTLDELGQDHDLTRAREFIRFKTNVSN